MNHARTTESARRAAAALVAALVLGGAPPASASGSGACWPRTKLAVAKTVSPKQPPANVDTPVAYTITVTNVGSRAAKGVVIEDPALPGFFGGPTATVTSDDPAATWTVASTSPLKVVVPQLGVGKHVVVRLAAPAHPTCATPTYTNVATAFAKNATKVSGSASLTRGVGAETCNGRDDDCDGLVDEGGDALCDDGNACTVDACVNGVCRFTNVTVCPASDQCHEAGTCNPSTGVCSNPAKPDGSPCSDGNGCTQSDACAAGACMPGVPLACRAQDACHQAGACDPETGTCANPAVPGCTLCRTAADCDDQNACTADTCDDGVCTHPAVAGCVTCSVAGQCDDGDPCTDDTCTAAGVCGHAPRPGCVACHQDTDCVDADPCTTNRCGEDGSCRFSAVPGCRPCETSSECDDGHSCTEDACVDGACAHTAVPGCTECEPTPEVCGDGVDNDCNGATDCDDAACTGSARCAAPAEICGDCVDNDGDGLVDYEDPDCCAQTVALQLSRLKLRPQRMAGHRGKRLRIRSAYTSPIPHGFDPMGADTQVQIRDAGGELFCARIPARYWRHPRRTIFRFKDKTETMTTGVRTSRFKLRMKKDVVRFRLAGKRTMLRDPAGVHVGLVVAVGNRCSAVDDVTLKAKKRGLVFP